MRTRLLPILMVTTSYVATIACGPVHPTTPQPPTWSLDVQVSDDVGGVADAHLEILDGPNKSVDLPRTDATGRRLLSNLIQSGFTICASRGDEYLPTCAGITLTSSQNVTLKLARAFVWLPRIGVSGRSFTIGGQLATIKGATAFPLMDRWAKGQDVTPFLNAYPRANLFIVFSYTSRNVWGDQAWDAPTPQQAADFVRFMNTRGKYVELVLLTSTGHVDEAKAILAAVAAMHPTNVLVRLGNEPEQQNGAGNPPYETLPLKDAADASGLIYDSGFYAGGARKWFGAPGRSYVSPHTERDAEAPRRTHDCYDLAHKPKDAPLGAQELSVPCFLGEPQKAGLMTTADAKAYGGSGMQFGAGVACHTETGKFLLLPTPQESAVCNALFDGVDAFPAGTNTGAYRRIDGVSLRTYVVGNTMVMIRPNVPGRAPEAGWRPLDADGILWSR